MPHEESHGQRVQIGASGNYRSRIRQLWSQDKQLGHQAANMGHGKYRKMNI